MDEPVIEQELDRSAAPIFFSFPLNGWCLRILDLDPMLGWKCSEFFRTFGGLLKLLKQLPWIRLLCGTKAPGANRT